MNMNMNMKVWIQYTGNRYQVLARRDHLLTSTSHRSGRDLNRLAAVLGSKNGEEGTNAPALREIVQARLPPSAHVSIAKLLSPHLAACMRRTWNRQSRSRSAESCRG